MGLWLCREYSRRILSPTVRVIIIIIAATATAADDDTVFVANVLPPPILYDSRSRRSVTQRRFHIEDDHENVKSNLLLVWGSFNCEYHNVMFFLVLFCWFRMLIFFFLIFLSVCFFIGNMCFSFRLILPECRTTNKTQNFSYQSLLRLNFVTMDMHWSTLDIL